MKTVYEEGREFVDRLESEGHVLAVPFRDWFEKVTGGPPAALTLPAELSDEEFNRLAARWRKAHTAAARTRQVVVLRDNEATATAAEDGTNPGAADETEVKL